MSEFNFGTARGQVTQRMIMEPISVPADKSVPLSQDLDKSKLITTFTIQNHTSNGMSVFLTNTQVFRPTGFFAAIEIPVGAMPSFTVLQEGRQLYEVQVLAMKWSGQQARDLVKVPVMLWDLTTWWLIGDAGHTGETANVTLTAFPLDYL